MSEQKAGAILTRPGVPFAGAAGDFTDSVAVFVHPVPSHVSLSVNDSHATVTTDANSAHTGAVTLDANLAAARALVCKETQTSLMKLIQYLKSSFIVGSSLFLRNEIKFVCSFLSRAIRLREVIVLILRRFGSKRLGNNKIG